MPNLTSILDRIRLGEPRATEEAFALVYDELRKMAANQVRSDSGDVLAPTELVHEAYLRLFGSPVTDGVRFADRAYFFAAAATAMRRVRVDRARSINAAKRGGQFNQVALDSGTKGIELPDLDLIALDEALNKLATNDPAKAKLVELRFFAGLSMPRVAEVMGVSLATAERQWAYVRAWLLVELSA